MWNREISLFHFSIVKRKMQIFEIHIIINLFRLFIEFELISFPVGNKTKFIHTFNASRELNRSKMPHERFHYTNGIQLVQHKKSFVIVLVVYGVIPLRASY